MNWTLVEIESKSFLHYAFRNDDFENTGGRDRHDRVYKFDEDQYRYPNQFQELEIRESDAAEFQKPSRTGLVQKSINTSSEFEKEEDKRVQRIIMSHKKTQTPIRPVANEAVQYDSDEWAQTKIKPIFYQHAKTPSDLSKRQKIEDEEEKLPLSSIKK